MQACAPGCRVSVTTVTDSSSSGLVEGLDPQRVPLSCLKEPDDALIILISPDSPDRLCQQPYMIKSHFFPLKGPSSESMSLSEMALG